MSNDFAVTRSSTCQLEAEVAGNTIRQGNHLLLFRSYEICDFILTHDDAEPLFPVGHHPKLTLIGRPVDVGKKDANGMLPLRFAGDPVDPTCSLFNVAGIPGEVVVDDMAAITLKVDSFTHHLAANEDVWKKGVLNAIINRLLVSRFVAPVAT